MVTKVRISVETKSVDIKYVHDWFHNQVSFNISAITSLQLCYESYVQRLQYYQQAVPLTKRSFSILLRQLLETHENKARVRIYQKSSIYIKGIELIQIHLN